MNFQPAIKWSGSKRSQAEEIIKLFPKEIDTYYEPFCGGCSVLRRLFSSDIKVNKYICSDLNGDLINLWNCIKNDFESVYFHYKSLWYELTKDENKERKKEFFNTIRERYNKDRNPLDFMFIMRTTTNGMPRYNNSGEFNNSFHITRDGIIPDKLYKILEEWSYKLNKKNVQFIVSDYKDIIPKENDFIYMDPPYANTKGMYFGSIDNEQLFDYIRNLKCKFALSFDGKSGDIDNTYNVPEDIYDKHIYIKSGNSSFKRVIGKSNNSIVYESLYLK
jgi:DNA adenine methylase